MESVPTQREVNVTDNTTTGLQVSSQCFPLRFEGPLPWESAQNVISLHTEELVRQLKDTVLLPLLFLIGGPANVINMAVFHRQGLKERINVCLFALALSDFLYLLFNMTVYAEQLYFHFTTKERYGPVLRFAMNHNLLGLYGFTWVSQILSALIASERCFCILQPLRSQNILSISTTTVIIVTTFIAMLGLYSLVTTRFRLVCVYDVVRRKTMWMNTSAQFFLDNQRVIDTFDQFIFGMAIPWTVITVVVVTTIVTMVKLRQAAAWRAGTSSGSVTSRELGVTVMLVYNSIFFVSCVFPVTLFRVIWLVLPEIIAGQGQHNLFFMCVWLADSTTLVNATFNIIIYYTMGSRYRLTFWQILACCKAAGHTRQSKNSTNATTAASLASPSAVSALDKEA